MEARLTASLLPLPRSSPYLAPPLTSLLPLPSGAPLRHSSSPSSTSLLLPPPPSWFDPKPSLIPSPPAPRYSFEALLITEFHGSTDFRFTAFHNPGVPPDRIPHVDVTGDQILQVWGLV